jgi:hypothetical protein
VESVDVRARVSGYLQSIHFADGAIVMTGRAVFSNPDLTLIPGLFARIRLPGSSQYQALLIPAVAEPRLPEEVRQIGVTTEKSSPDFLLVAHLLSPDDCFACRIRLRPILMTSFAFTLGVVPLFVAAGAGAEMLRALGTSVLSGMLGVTCFGLLLTPVFYVVIRWCVERRREKPEPSSNHVGILAIIALVPCLLLLSGRMLVGPDYKAPPLQAPAGFANKVGNQC